MELVSEEFSARVASMAVVDSKEAALWPVLVLSVRWLGDIENDGHSVFIVIPYEALVCNCRVGSHNSISFHTALSWLLIRDNDSCPRLEGKFRLVSFFLS